MIISATPTTNYGTNAIIAVGDASAAASAAYRTAVKWNLSAIPASARVTAVALALDEYSAFDTGGVGSWSASLYTLLRNWVEAEITWNQYSSGNNWTTAGAAGVGTDISAAIDSLTLDGTAAAGFVTWSGSGLLAVVQGWIDGTYSNYGVLIAATAAEYRGVAPLSGNLFRSTDYGTSGDRPKLTVTYAIGGPLVNNGLVNSGLVNGGLVR